MSVHIPGTMTAVKLVAGAGATLVTVPVPCPAPGEVLLRVLGAGLCQTDLHICSGHDSRTPDGTILGHEIAGEIVALGEGVEQFGLSTRVAVHPCITCGHCVSCRSGRENDCRNTGGRLKPPTTPGVDRDGGMAGFVALPAQLLHAIDDLDPLLAAVLPDAGLTAYHAVRTCHEHLRPNASAVVIGVGGLGSMAARYIRATSAARLIIGDVSDAALAASASVADLILRSDAPDCAARVLDFAGEAGVDAVLDFVGTNETLALASDVVCRGGAIRLVGLNGGVLPFMAKSTHNPMPRGTTLALPYSGTYAEFAEVIALAQAGKVSPMVTSFPLERVNEVMAMLARGEIRGRAVLVPS